MTADGPVPIKTIVIGHQQELLSTPAYPGANHDVNGYCIRHHKVRLSQPVLDESAKTGCVAEPIKKYKVIRKICPHCGVHQSAQRQFRAQGSGGSDRREVVNTFSNALVPKAVPRKNIRGSGIGGIATTDPSGGRNKHDVSNITHKSQHQNASGRSRAKGGREKDAVKTSLKAKDKATAKYKVKEGKKNAGMIRDEKKEKKRTNVKTKEGDREKDALTTSLNAKDKSTEKGKVKERNKGDRLVRDGKKEKDISYVKSREKDTKPAGRDRAKDGCNEKVNNKKDGNSVDEGRTGDAAKEKGIRGRAEKKEISAERIIDADKDKGTRDRTDTKESTAARQSGTLANHDHSPSHGYYDQHVDSVSGPGCITKKGGVYHIKKRANDDIPSARSPKVPKHAVQFTRGGSQELNSNSPLIRSVPFKTEEIKESTEDNDNESEQRATHVYMMAAGLLPLHNNYRDRDYEHEGNQLVKKRAENQDSADKEKERDNAIKDRVRERAVNSSAKVQPKKTPGNSSNGKSECNELFESHDSKVPAYSIKETSNGNGKKDPNKLWESHNNINKETLLADRHKQDFNKSSEVKKDISIKIASDRISSKNKEYKGKQPLATSINEHDPGKGKIKAKSGGQSEASGSGDGNCAGNHAVNNNVRHGGKNKDRITGKETHGSNERSNHRHKARGRPPNTEEKVLRFRRGSSLDSRRSGGNSATERNDHNEKGGSQTVRNGNVSRDRIRSKRLDYQRSKSLPHRQQRKRVPSEYHVAQQQPQYSTLSTSRQTFLDQMANMSIYVPNKTKPTERSASQVPASKNQRHDG